MGQPPGDAANTGAPLREQTVAIERASLAFVEVTLAALASTTDLSVLQARVLLAVQRHRPQTLSDLGPLMDMSAPATSRIVTRWWRRACWSGARPITIAGRRRWG